MKMQIFRGLSCKSVFLGATIFFSSCKEDMVLESPEMQMQRDPLLQRYVESAFEEVTLIKKSVDISAYQKLQSKQEKEAFVQQLQKTARNGELTLTQARKNTFNFTSKLYQKYVSSGKLSKTSFLAITAKKRLEMGRIHDN